MDNTLPILIAGLGNPGKEYVNTRHNIGFVVVDELAKKLGFTWKLEKKRKAEVAQGTWGHQPIILAKPQTYMNLSGEALGSLAGYFKIPGARIIAIFDDVTLPLGRVKVSLEGGTGGHNGVENLVQHLGKGFMRFRIGIGQKTHPAMDLKDYVLGTFLTVESTYIETLLPNFIEGLHLLIDKGAVSAMNVLNQIPKPKKDNQVSKTNTHESVNQQQL